ncbi:MAG: hypothetical protein AB1546_09950 [bacterium]
MSETINITCQTGAVGSSNPTETDYEKFCSSAKYYLCDTYQITIGMKPKIPSIKKH